MQQTIMTETDDSMMCETENHPLFASLDIPADWAKIVKSCDVTEHLTVSCWEGKPTQDWILNTQSPPLFCIGLILDGQGTMAFEGAPELTVNSNMVVVCSTSEMSNGRDHFKGGLPVRMVDIRFTPESLYLAGGLPLMALKGHLFKKHSLPSDKAFLGAFQLSPQLKKIANEMLTCDFSNSTLRQLFLRAKSMEVLATLLDQIGTAKLSHFASRDRRQLNEALHLLEQDYAKNWTLDNLSRHVGLNEKKLQSGFQSMVGHSVRSYLRKVRLDSAYALLKQGSSVTTTAHSVGFSSLSHFSHSFRQQHGILPSEV